MMIHEKYKFQEKKKIELESVMSSRRKTKVPFIEKYIICMSVRLLDSVHNQCHASLLKFCCQNVTK